MTQDDIIRMAEEARLAFGSEEYPEIWQVYLSVGRKEIERFAALVAAAEREACAKVCENEWSNAAERMYGQECAETIRAMGVANGQEAQ